MSSITITVPMNYYALTRASDMLHGMALDLDKSQPAQSYGPYVQQHGRARRFSEGWASVDDLKISEQSRVQSVAGGGGAPGGEISPSGGGSGKITPDYSDGFTDGHQQGLEEGERYNNPDADTSHIEALIPASEGGTMPETEKDAASVFGSQPGKPATTTEAATTATAPEPAPPAETTPPPAATAEAPAPAPSATEAAATTTSASAGVDLDSDGLPWDSRIHAGSKSKLAKTKQWKKKRGVDPSLVEKVEAELHAAMAAGPANPVDPAPAPATEAQPTPASPAPAPPVEEVKPAATGAITTFPALMKKITDTGTSQADVTAAVNKQGLPALPLLAARPDLIPAVAAELFGG